MDWTGAAETLSFEINHYFSPYIAEMANALSNLFSIAISLCGFRETRIRGRELPLRYGIGYLVCATAFHGLEIYLSERVLSLQGIALVGLGSFFFHTTLLFEAQLADELPMIYVSSANLFFLFDNQLGFGLKNARSQTLLIFVALFDVLFSWS